MFQMEDPIVFEKEDFINAYISLSELRTMVSKDKNGQAATKHLDVALYLILVQIEKMRGNTNENVH